jgi:hypothetical protein
MEIAHRVLIGGTAMPFFLIGGTVMPFRKSLSWSLRPTLTTVKSLRRRSRMTLCS